eukprot:scaffold102891_cov72-Phaeocystis_antarctica.AAC.1
MSEVADETECCFEAHARGATGLSTRAPADTWAPVDRRDARLLLKHGVGPEVDQVPVENLRRLNCGRAVHPRAERTQDIIQDCSTAEALKCRLELCMYDSMIRPLLQRNCASTGQPCDASVGRSRPTRSHFRQI